MLISLLRHPLVHGALAGALSAAVVDYAAFKNLKNWHDVLVYDWATASFRWVMGGVAGLISAAGLGAVGA